MNCSTANGAGSSRDLTRQACEPDEPLGALERQLDSFDAIKRREALGLLMQQVGAGAIALPPITTDINLHVHTSFSYNGYGFSPSKFAWLARRRGLAVAGITDFDVLDGLSEFYEAGRILGLKTCVSLESRVSVPEFATREINSPGEPGIAYHMGVGFPAAVHRSFLALMRENAAQRTRDMAGRINRYLDAVQVDFDVDVLPLTPGGNATERHLCQAYEKVAIAAFPDSEERGAFWREKIGDFPHDSVRLQNLLRAKLMKRGGVGYVQPDAGTFPRMADMNRFVLEAGGIPTVAWLDGSSAGEGAMEELLQTAMAGGAAALNIIPDRNYTPGCIDQKWNRLRDTVALAVKLDLPVIVGTEMNAPGQKFVDDFAAAELKPFLPVFWRGAHIAYAHVALQRECGLGYLSTWAQRRFESVRAKNDFFEELGQVLRPASEERLRGADECSKPSEILNLVR